MIHEISHENTNPINTCNSVGNSGKDFFEQMKLTTKEYILYVIDLHRELKPNKKSQREGLEIGREHEGDFLMLVMYLIWAMVI